MRIWTMGAILGGAVVALAVPVAAQQNGSFGNQPAAPVRLDVGASALADQTFVTQAVDANDRAIDQAQVELGATSDTAIRAFAKAVIHDDVASNTQLAAIANYLGLTYSHRHVVQLGNGTAIGSVTPPRNATRALAPTEYMTQQMHIEEQVAGLYRGEAGNGSSQLRTYAADTLPAIDAHAQMAQRYLSAGAPGTQTNDR